MGNGINNWDPNNLFGSWRNVCMNFDRMMPFMGQTLWQVGPMPWMMNNNGMFANSLWGQVGDFTQFNGSASSTSNDPAKNTTQTHEERRAAHIKKVELEKKFDKVLKVLNEYVETLDDSPEKTGLKFDIDAYDNSKTEENYAKLLEVYNENKDKIKTSLIENEKLTAKEKADLTTAVTNLDISINDDNDKTYSSILKSGLAGLKDDVDVLDLISTYNTKKDTGKPDFITAIVSKYKTSANEKKSSFETLADKIEIALEAKYNAIKDNNYLSDETKKDLKKAFENFDSLNKKLDDANYVKVFNDFYRQLRLAEAEKADASIAEKLGFLHESENEFESGKLKNEVVDDLTNEGFDEPTVAPIDLPPAATTTTATATASATASATTPAGTASSTTTTFGLDAKSRATLDILSESGSLNPISYKALVKDVIQNQNVMNKDTIVDILDEYPDLITDLATKRVKKDTINRVVKAVMRKAIELNLTDANEYKELQTFFGASGTPKYKNNGFEVDAVDEGDGVDTFGFTKHTGGVQFIREDAQKVQDMVKALVDIIKATA